MKRNIQPITGCGEGDITPYFFLCGDPGRVAKIWPRGRRLAPTCQVPELRMSLTGRRDGVALTAASTGMGGPSTAIVVEELAKLGAQVLIRVGNGGAVADAVSIGDYVITTGSVRDDGTTRSYVIPEYPAVAHYEVVGALVKAAREAGGRPPRRDHVVDGRLLRAQQGAGGGRRGSGPCRFRATRSPG